MRTVWETCLNLMGSNWFVIPHYGRLGRVTDEYRRWWDAADRTYWCLDHPWQEINFSRRDGRVGKRFTSPPFSQIFKLDYYPPNWKELAKPRSLEKDEVGTEYLLLRGETKSFFDDLILLFVGMREGAVPSREERPAQGLATPRRNGRSGRIDRAKRDSKLWSRVRVSEEDLSVPDTSSTTPLVKRVRVGARAAPTMPSAALVSPLRATTTPLRGLSPSSLDSNGQLGGLSSRARAEASPFAGDRVTPSSHTAAFAAIVLAGAMGRTPILEAPSSRSAATPTLESPVSKHAVMEKHERLRARHLSDQDRLTAEISSLSYEIQVAESRIGELQTRAASLKSRCLFWQEMVRRHSQSLERLGSETASVRDLANAVAKSIFELKE
ncbi:hypothetical protein AMTR_s00207p00025690 [Amborella trichopoda]|uniref:Uncharacterized protein n=1 Tax=Amborella trichopoda TaxID=13333 RepID=W1NZG9_AMBTC|nr:hypothetical protein AMTR_s00207p00025690 [Amborella trichopoda]